jgi:hypothetical protein
LEYANDLIYGCGEWPGLGNDPNIRRDLETMVWEELLRRVVTGDQRTLAFILRQEPV